MKHSKRVEKEEAELKVFRRNRFTSLKLSEIFSLIFTGIYFHLQFLMSFLRRSTAVNRHGCNENESQVLSEI